MVGKDNFLLSIWFSSTNCHYFSGVHSRDNNHCYLPLVVVFSLSSLAMVKFPRWIQCRVVYFCLFVLLLCFPFEHKRFHKLLTLLYKYVDAMRYYRNRVWLSWRTHWIILYKEDLRGRENGLTEINRIFPNDK